MLPCSFVVLVYVTPILTLDIDRRREDMSLPGAAGVGHS